MINYIVRNTLLALLVCFTISCAGDKSASDVQSYTSGIENILVDESFAPIVEDQQYVFESTYENAKLRLVLKAENELVNLLMYDTAQVAIMSRTLTDAEQSHFRAKQIKIRLNRFAVDGIALIVHKSVKDSTTEVGEIIKILKGQQSSIDGLVFDNPNSSTVRYFKELADVNTLPEKGIYALKTNADVIRYVYENPGTVGVIGVNWMVQPPEDMEKLVGELKVLGVKNVKGKAGDDGYYKPVQSDIALGLYPLTRDLYIINCEGGAGLGTGFASFVAGERGQRIVLKSGLLPDSIPSREINIVK